MQMHMHEFSQLRKSALLNDSAFGVGIIFSAKKVNVEASSDDNHTAIQIWVRKMFTWARNRKLVSCTYPSLRWKQMTWIFKGNPFDFLDFVEER